MQMFLNQISHRRISVFLPSFRLLTSKTSPSYAIFHSIVILLFIFDIVNYVQFSSTQPICHDGAATSNQRTLKLDWLKSLVLEADEFFSHPIWRILDYVTLQ